MRSGPQFRKMSTKRDLRSRLQAIQRLLSLEVPEPGNILCQKDLVTSIKNLSILIPVPLPVAGEFVHDAVVEGEVYRQPDGQGDDDALQDIELPAQEDQGGDGGEDDQEHSHDGQQTQTQAPGEVMSQLFGLIKYFVKW